MIYRIINLSFKEPLNKNNEERLISYFQSLKKQLDDGAKKNVESALALINSGINKIPILGKLYELADAKILSETLKTMEVGKLCKMDKIDKLNYCFGYPFDFDSGMINERGMQKELVKKFPGIIINKTKVDINVNKDTK